MAEFYSWIDEMSIYIKELTKILCFDLIQNKQKVFERLTMEIIDLLEKHNFKDREHSFIYLCGFLENRDVYWWDNSTESLCSLKAVPEGFVAHAAKRIISAIEEFNDNKD